MMKIIWKWVGFGDTCAMIPAHSLQREAVQAARDKVGYVLGVVVCVICPEEQTSNLTMKIIPILDILVGRC